MQSAVLSVLSSGACTGIDKAIIVRFLLAELILLNPFLQRAFTSIKPIAWRSMSIVDQEGTSNNEDLTVVQKYISLPFYFPFSTAS